MSTYIQSSEEKLNLQNTNYGWHTLKTQKGGIVRDRHLVSKAKIYGFEIVLFSVVGLSTIHDPSPSRVCVIMLGYCTPGKMEGY